MPSQKKKDDGPKKTEDKAGFLAKGPRLVKNIVSSAVTRGKKLNTARLLKSIDDDFTVALTDLRKKTVSLYGADESEDDAFRNVELPRDPYFEKCGLFATCVLDVADRCDALGPVVNESQISEVVLAVIGEGRAAEVEELTREVIDMGLVSTTAETATAPLKRPFIPVLPSFDSDDEDGRDLEFDNEPPSVVHMRYVRHIQKRMKKYVLQRSPKNIATQESLPTPFDVEKELQQAGMKGTSMESVDDSDEESD